MLTSRRNETQIEPGITSRSNEVTPEMIEAGVEEFLSYDSRVDRIEDTVAEIFRQMLSHRTRR